MVLKMAKGRKGRKMMKLEKGDEEFRVAIGEGIKSRSKTIARRHWRLILSENGNEHARWTICEHASESERTRR